MLCTISDVHLFELFAPLFFILRKSMKKEYLSDITHFVPLNKF